MRYRDNKPCYPLFCSAVVTELACYLGSDMTAKFKRDFGDPSVLCPVTYSFLFTQSWPGSILTNSQKEGGKLPSLGLRGKEQCSDYQFLLQFSGGSNCLRANPVSGQPQDRICSAPSVLIHPAPSVCVCPVFEFSLLFIRKKPWNCISKGTVLPRLPPQLDLTLRTTAS